MLGWLRGRGTASQGAPARGPVRGAEEPEEPMNMSPEDVARALAGPEPPLVLDVRTPAEYAAGHIRQAHLVPLPQLGGRLGELPGGQPIVCVCHSGHRSGVAARQLRSRGYRVRNMTGGMLNWRGAVVRGPGAGS